MSDMLILFLIIAVVLWLHIASNWGYWPMRKCPSGKSHRVVVGTVKDYLGREWCFHKDCTRDAFKKVAQESESSFDSDPATSDRDILRGVRNGLIRLRNMAWNHADHDDMGIAALSMLAVVDKRLRNSRKDKAKP